MAVEVEIKARHMIKPAEKTWTGTLKLSEIDMVYGKVFAPKLYVYNNKEKWDPTFINHTLKESLGKALVHFYPLTGRLKPIGGGRLELHVDNVDVTSGVPLVEAEADVELSDLGEDLMEADVKGSLNNLYCSEHDPDKPLQDLPLLMVQITHFRCGGVVLAITFSHAVVDGIAVSHFYSEWTRLARGESLEMAPIHDRSFLRAGESPRSTPKFFQQVVNQPPLPHNITIQQGVDQPPSQQTTIEMLRFSKSQIEKLKQSTCHVINAHPYTRFEVMSAHIWRCITKAKENEGKKITALAMAIDIRKRINPPLPRAFNGNGAILMSVVSDSKDLISNPLDYACEKIRKTINSVTNDVIWAYLDYLKSVDDIDALKGTMSPEGFFVNPDVIMVNWLNLTFNNLDFGWGNELYMMCETPHMEGRVFVRADREEGSAIVTICLEVTHMDKFKYYFRTSSNTTFIGLNKL